MRIIPIVNQLASYLPFFTDKFTTPLTISGATQSSGVAVIETTSPHNLSVGDTIVVTGIVPYIPIDSLELVGNDQIIVRTSVDNSLTSTFDFKTRLPLSSATPLIYIEGTVDPQLSGEFDIVRVPNRFSAIYQLLSTPTLPLVASGFILKYAYNSYIGVKTVSAIIDPTTFSYSVNSSEPSITNNSGLIHTAPRVAGAVSVERAQATYTAQSFSDYWLFVTPGESFSSKDPYTLNDGLSSLHTGNIFRQKLIDKVALNLFIPTSDTLNAASQIDSVEDIKISIFKSLLRLNSINEYNAPSNFQLIFESSFLFGYDKAYLIYQYIIQTRYDVTYFDTFDGQNYFPFRDINGDSIINSKEYLWNVDLDVDKSF